MKNNTVKNSGVIGVGKPPAPNWFFIELENR